MPVPETTLRPLLLLQCRNPDDPMRQHEIECFVWHSGVARDAISVINVPERMPDREDIQRCSGVLMGGSGDYSSLDDEHWIDGLIDFCRDELIANGKPTFASCFGFQILVRAVGGVMIRDPAKTEFGTYDLELTVPARNDPIFGDLPRVFPAQVGHHDRARWVPEHVRTLASTPLCPIHAFRIGDLPIWATQFHPELTMDDLKLRYSYYQHYADDVGDAQPTMGESQAASTLLARFVQWLQTAEGER